MADFDAQIIESQKQMADAQAKISELTNRIEEEVAQVFLDRRKESALEADVLRRIVRRRLLSLLLNPFEDREPGIVRAEAVCQRYVSPPAKRRGQSHEVQEVREEAWIPGSDGGVEHVQERRGNRLE